MSTQATTTSWTIRRATDADGDALAAVIAAIWRSYLGIVFDRAAELPELDAPASHYGGLGGALWVLEGADGAVLGSIATTPVPSRPGTWELFKLYLASGLRGTGAAQALLAVAEEHAMAHGAARMVLWTDTRFEAAHRFYAKQGYERLPGSRALHDLSDTIEYAFSKDLPVTLRDGERVA